MANLTTITVRNPYRMTEGGMEKSVGGLSGAVDNLMRKSGGNWVSSSPTNDSETYNMQDYQLYMTPLNCQLYESPYDKFVNNQIHATMNGLYDEYSLPAMSERGWGQFNRVNETLAEKALEVSSENTTYLLNGYHLFMAPQRIRELSPDADIVLFIHTMFPEPTEFNKMDKSQTMLESINLCDKIIVHTRGFAENLRNLFEVNNVNYQGEIIVQPAPINTERLDIEYEEKTQNDTTLLFSTDRMDYHKGIPLKLRSFDIFLRENQDLHGSVRLKQKLTLGRCHSLSQHTQQYQTVQEIVENINHRHGTDDWTPVQITSDRMSEEKLLNQYVQSDGLLVTPLTDGLNMTVLEYLICNRYANSDAYPIVTNTTGCTDVVDELRSVEPDSGEIADAIEEFIRVGGSYRIKEDNIPKVDDLIESISL